MISLKDITLELIKQLPESVTPEEIMYKVNLAAQVIDGLSDAENDQVITTEEILKRVDSWSK